MNKKKSLEFGKLSVDNEICLKGILAILIIISHSTFANSIKLGTHTLGDYNYFIVALFFFISGFGLMCQRQVNKEFNLLKKIKNLAIPYYIVGVLWMLLFEKSFTFDSFVRLLFFNKIIPYCWYIKTQLLLYIIWWITIKLSDQYKFKNACSIFAMIFFQLLLYSCYQNYSLVTSTTYITVFNFLFGVIYAYYGDKMYNLFKKLHVLQIILLVAVFFMTKYFPREEKLISYIILNLTSGFFSVAVFQFLYIINFQNIITYFVGKRSYYIYLVQCIAQCIFSKTYFCKVTYYIVDDIYLCVLYTVITDLIIASIIYFLYNFLDDKLKRVGARIHV